MNYVMQDWQGSTRAVVNAHGFVRSRNDYTVFGEDIQSGTGLRTENQGFGLNTSVRQKYGLTERDDATGLDHTWFRKHETQAGRWTSPDPYNGSMNIGDPQSFNRYSYVENDPTNYVDPSGLNASSSGGSYFCYDIVTWGHFPDEPDNTYINTTTVCVVFGGGATTGGGNSYNHGGGWYSGGVSLLPEDTDCERFANRVAEIAAKHDNAEDFADELAKVFIGILSSDIDEMGENANGSIGERFRSSGFKRGLYDALNDPQPRHFVGGIIAGYRLGSTAGLAVMNHNEPSDADLALNKISIPLGAKLTPTPQSRYQARSRDWVTDRIVPANPGFKGLADAIRDRVCE